MEFKIYFEGGGDSTAGKASLRQGMRHFLGELFDAARERSIRCNLVACGSRNDTFDRFKHEAAASPETFCVLLVDSEDAVKTGPISHLTRRDSWSFADTDENSIHLMVRTMETWIVADQQSLADYYGHHFNAKALPVTDDLETVDKRTIRGGLKRATRKTQKGSYEKIRHASDLLARIDPATVRRRCRHCDRLFVTLSAKM
ncbi:MAG: DUF4276 family protein [Candidatus Riflebacteria bacterium]|nr:DUF4276 family protein [Candidatus Riflebacteria bacterium]